MRFATGPFTLTAGQAVNVPAPTNAPVGAVVLSNISPFLLTVNTSTGREWLGPWSENLYLAPAGHQQLTVTPQTVPNSGATGSAPNQLQATWYTPDDIPKGTWPVSLTAQAIAAAISGTVTALQPSSTITVPNPPTSGRDWSYTFAASGALRAVSANFVASVAVANRIIRIALDDPTGNDAWIIEAAAPVTAGQNVYHNLTPGVQPTFLAPSGGLLQVSLLPIPSIAVTSGWRIFSTTQNINSGDQWSFIVITLG